MSALLMLVAGAVQSAETGLVNNVPARASLDELPRIKAERDRLFPQMMSDPANLDIAFRYAALSSQAGDLEGAISTLERMLIYAPGLPRLQLELGVLYYRLSAYDVAKGYFTSAIAAPGVPEEVKTKVETYLAAIDARTAVDRFSGTITTGIRWQSNANAATSSRTVQTTLLTTPLLLNDSALSDSDFNGFVAGNFRYSRDLESQGDRLEATLQTYGALYAEHNEINTGLAELHLGPTFDLERFDMSGTSLSTYAIVGDYVLDGDQYLFSGGVGTALTKELDAQTRLIVGGEYRREIFNDSSKRPTASDRTGDRFRGSMTLQRLITPDLSTTVTLLGEKRSANKDYLSLTEVGIGLGFSLNFASPFAKQEDPWTVGVNVGITHRSYDEPDTVFSATDAQVDNEAFAEMSLLVPLKRDWALQTVIGYRNVNSNYDIYSYDNFSASLGVIKKF